MKYEVFSMTVLVLLGVIGYLCMKLNMLRSASRRALWELLEDERLLRHGIMAGFSPDGWARTRIEHRRQDVMSAVQALIIELKQEKGLDLVESSLRSLQDPKNWEDAQFMAKGAAEALRQLDG